MKGWAIFVHSVRLVMNNIDVALRVSLVLYLVQGAYQLTAFQYAPEGGGQPAQLPPQAALPLLVLGIAAVIASLWIAVAWHRFVLLEERPSGWLPNWHGGKILGYLGRSMLIGVLISVVLLVTLSVVMVIPPLQVVILPGMVLAGSYFFFRLGVMLPAGAIDRKMKLAESWNATKDKDGAIVVLALIMMAGAFVLQIPSLVNGDPSSPISLVYDLVTGWFATMIGVSILTTLYGHYVEGRDID
ncbi:hypothetical protein [Primorskyibacter sp. 2E233]|uniref:hypothetical protein n=1 Tax=Primorskyibacter sp. 2E233 TaxID=3413431 RepID=UPI003BF429A1